MATAVKPWVCFSSSSGETFRAVWHALKPEHRAAMQGFFVDRECGALGVARREWASSQEGETCDFAGFPRKEFEARYLAWQAASGFRGMILLCGFFAILSPDFLERCGSVVVNTHPSLLPAFPGKDEAVNKKAHETASISGFTVHLVDDSLDGGPILFQHPVVLDPDATYEANRARVRAAEQKWLPRVWSRLLELPIQADERRLGSLELRRRHGLSWNTFKDVE